jgi:hypothetical protein
MAMRYVTLNGNCAVPFEDVKMEIPFSAVESDPLDGSETDCTAFCVNMFRLVESVREKRLLGLLEFVPGAPSCAF